jgi:hypothetical protein
MQMPVRARPYASFEPIDSLKGHVALQKGRKIRIMEDGNV